MAIDEGEAQDFMDSTFNSGIKESDMLFTGLLLASVFTGASMVYTNLPEKDLNQISQAGIKEKEARLRGSTDTKIILDAFTFKGYEEGRTVKMITATGKQYLVENYGFKESLFKGYQVLDTGKLSGILTNAIPKSIVVEERLVGYIIEEKELSRLMNLLEENKMLGRLEDPNTIENLTMRNSQMISDSIGQYGNVIGYKEGYLKASSYASEGVLIHWIPAGRNTCNICDKLARLGPYLPWMYPVIPHYHCQCYPGSPVPMGANQFGVYQAYPQRYATGDFLNAM